MFCKSAALVVAGLALGANAHLFISSPTPIEGTNPKDPLDASGSNFPCHGVSLPTSGGEKMAAGSSQLLKFDNGDGANTAVHGGGSCQLSITYETDPTKVKDPKSWYVIYSIEGGCPTNTYQNLDAGSYQGPEGSYSGALQCTDPKANGVDCINQFNFTIPKGVKDGHAIMAWTWFNAVGNRELYMNCINTELSGGDGSEMGNFPSMFVANMADISGGNCPTTESQAVKFPYAGKYVTTKLADPVQGAQVAYPGSSFPIVQPTGANCANDGTPAGGAAPGGGVPAPTASNSAPAYGSGPPAQPTGNSGSAGGLATKTTMITVTGSGVAPSSMASGSVAAPSAPMGGSSAAPSAPVGGSSAAPSAPAAPSAAPSYPAAPSGSTGSSSGSCSNGKVSCSNQGGVVCIGSAQFGICDIDGCAVPQALAAGTKCSGGTISKRSHIRHAPLHGAHRHIL